MGPARRQISAGWQKPRRGDAAVNGRIRARTKHRLIGESFLFLGGKQCAGYSGQPSFLLFRLFQRHELCGQLTRWFIYIYVYSDRRACVRPRNKKLIHVLGDISSAA